MSRAYDVYLNGKGYMLAKGAGGTLRPGALQARRQDPFTRHLSEEGKWSIQKFEFGDGAGSVEYDGSHRYRWAKNIDTRSGRLLLGPKWTVYNADDASSLVDDTPAGYTIPAGEGLAVKFTFGASRDIRHIGVLLARVDGEDYDGAADIEVELWSDSAGTPNAVLADEDLPLEEAPEAWMPFENLWQKNQFAWFEVRMDSANAITTGWIHVWNHSTADIRWGHDGATSATLADWSGSAFGTPYSGYQTYYKAKDEDGVDALVRDIITYRSTGGQRKVYAAVGGKLMEYDEPTDTWTNIKDTFAVPVLDLTTWNGNLFCALGEATPYEYWNGTSWNGTPTVEKAQCFGLHDNLFWIAYGHKLNASKTGDHDDWDVCEGTIGDPGTPIQALTSHGGKLFALKPEGLYEISYPDNYPGADLECFGNLAHDFSTELTGRGFLIDWHSGLYWPSDHGLYRWAGGTLQDVWRSRQESTSGGPYNPPYEPWSGKFTAACATTRGIILVQCNPRMNLWTEHTTVVWFYDGRHFHPMMKEATALGERGHAAGLQSLGEGEGNFWYGHGFEIRKVPWPTWTDNRYRGDVDCYVGIAQVHFPEFVGGKAHELKDWSKVRLHLWQLDDEDPATEVSVRASIDGGADQTLSVIGSPGWYGPVVDYSFPAETRGYRCEIKLLMNAPDVNTVGPEISQVDLFYLPLPETVTQYELSIMAADGVKLHTGAREDRTAKEIVDDVNTLVEKAEPFTFTDEFGEDHSVRVMGITRSPSAVKKITTGIEGFKVESIITLGLLDVGLTSDSPT